MFVSVLLRNTVIWLWSDRGVNGLMVNALREKGSISVIM